MFNWKINMDHKGLRILTNICHLPEACPVSLLTVFNLKDHKATKINKQEAPYVGKF
jgi:hypothetical protein